MFLSMQCLYIKAEIDNKIYQQDMKVIITPQKQNNLSTADKINDTF